MVRAIAITVALGLASAPALAGKMYWRVADCSAGQPDGKIQRANLDGSDQEDILTGLLCPTSIVLDVDAGHLYWIEAAGESANRVLRANLDGTNVVEILAGLQNPLACLDIDRDNGKLYWSDIGSGPVSFDGAIRRANLDGSNLETVVSGLDGPLPIGVDPGGGKVYWGDAATDLIQRANLDGSGLETLIATGIVNPNGMALDASAGKMYWSDFPLDIKRADLDGSSVEDVTTSAPSAPSTLALDVSAGKLYWTETSGGAIRRSNLDGTGLETILVGLENPFGLAVTSSACCGDDFDGDGIEDPVDGTFTGVFNDESGVFSDNFTDQNLGGVSFGAIDDRNGLDVSIADAVSPFGLQVSGSGAGGPARLGACDLGEPDSILVFSGGTARITCGSLTIETLAGQVEFELALNAILTIPPGATVTITELGNGEFLIENVTTPGGPAAILDDNGSVVEIDPGSSTEFPSAVPLSSPASLIALVTGLLTVLTLAVLWSRPRVREI